MKEYVSCCLKLVPLRVKNRLLGESPGRFVNPWPNCHKGLKLGKSFLHLQETDGSYHTDVRRGYDQGLTACSSVINADSEAPIRACQMNFVPFVVVQFEVRCLQFCLS